LPLVPNMKEMVRRYPDWVSRQEFLLFSLPGASV
jgi:hypothetical protein